MAKTDPIFCTNIFHDKFTLWYSKLAIYIIFLIKNCIHLVLSSLEIQRRVQVYYIFLLFLKRDDSQTFKSINCKNFSSSVCYCYNLLRCFLFHMITGRYRFFTKVYRYPEVSSTAMHFRSLKQVNWKKTIFYFLSTQ